MASRPRQGASEHPGTQQVPEVPGCPAVCGRAGQTWQARRPASSLPAGGCQLTPAGSSPGAGRSRAPRLWFRYTEGFDKPIVRSHMPIVFDLGSDPGKSYNLFNDKMDIGWEAAVVLPVVYEYESPALLELPDGRSPRWHKVRDDERGREEEQAEDEIPDEAVPLSASNTCGPERDCDPNESTQDPQKEKHGKFLSAFEIERSYLLPSSSVAAEVSLRSQPPISTSKGFTVCQQRVGSARNGRSCARRRWAIITPHR